MTEPTSNDRNDPNRYDVLRYSDGTHRSVPAGAGQQIIATHESEARKRRWFASVAAGVVMLVIVVIGGSWALDGIHTPAGIGFVVGVVVGVARYWQLDYSDQIPDLVASDAPTQVVRKYTDEFDSNKTGDSITDDTRL